MSVLGMLRRRWSGQREWSGRPTGAVELAPEPRWRRMVAGDEVTDGAVFELVTQARRDEVERRLGKGVWQVGEAESGELMLGFVPAARVGELDEPAAREAFAASERWQVVLEFADMTVLEDARGLGA